jgi:hypothetical protein
LTMASSEDVYLLGICCNLHEASAAIVKNGVLIAAAEEERFSRRKHDNSFPVGAIDYCLREAGVSMSDVSIRGLLLAAVEGPAEASVVAGALLPRFAPDLPGRQALAGLGGHPPATSRGAVQAAADGIPRHVLLHRSPRRARRQRLSCFALRVGSDHHLGPVRRELHDAARARGRASHPAHPAVLPAALAWHLLRRRSPSFSGTTSTSTSTR